jgi:hypothetical protein
MMTLLPEVGYLADTPLATSGSLSNALSSAFNPSALTVLLDEGLPLVWNGRSASSGSDSLDDQLRQYYLGSEQSGLQRWVNIDVHSLGSFLEPILVVILLLDHMLGLFNLLG